MWLPNERTLFWWMDAISAISISLIFIIQDRIGGEALLCKSGEHSYYSFQIFTQSRRTSLVLHTNTFLFPWQPAEFGWLKRTLVLSSTLVSCQPSWLIIKDDSKTWIRQSCNLCSDFLFFFCLFFHLVCGFIYLWGFPCCSLVSDASVSLVYVVSPCARQAPFPR